MSRKVKIAAAVFAVLVLIGLTAGEEDAEEAATPEPSPTPTVSVTLSAEGQAVCEDATALAANLPLNQEEKGELFDLAGRVHEGEDPELRERVYAWGDTYLQDEGDPQEAAESVLDLCSRAE